MVNSQEENFCSARKLARDLKTRANVSCARSCASSSSPTMRQRKWKTGAAWRSIRSFSAASWPACNFSMSARSRASAGCAEASGEGWASVGMLMAGVARSRHAGFHLLVRAERELLHFNKVAPALFRRHRLADGDEVLEHLRLALRPQSGDFVQFCLRFGGNVGAAAQDGFQFALFRGDLRTHLGAFRQIAFMQFADARHFRAAQVKFILQPAQIVRRPGAAGYGDALGGEIRTGKYRRGQRERAEQDEHTSELQSLR